MRRSVVLGMLVAVGALSVGIAGQQQRATLPDAVKVKDNFYVIGSSSPVDRSQFTGGNVSVFVTDAGVTVVDSKLAGYGPDIIAKIKAVTNKPITTLINTHTHGDHTGSNEGFPASVNIVAHENTKTLMAPITRRCCGAFESFPAKTQRRKEACSSSASQAPLTPSGWRFAPKNRQRLLAPLRLCGKRFQRLHDPVGFRTKQSRLVLAPFVFQSIFCRRWTRNPACPYS